MDEFDKDNSVDFSGTMFSNDWYIFNWNGGNFSTEKYIRQEWKDSKHKNEKLNTRFKHMF